MIETSIITPVWNRADLTSQYLYDHFGRYANRKNTEWIIVDNGSTDETPASLDYWQRMVGGRLVVIHNEKNLGYSKANNQGVAVARGDIFVFLNNDIIIQGDYLTPLEEAVTANPRALVGAQLVSTNTGWNQFGDEIIPYLVGWCFAMSRIVFTDIGGFDERYTFDYEDSDLCKAAVQKGYDLKEVPLPIQHLGNQSGKLLEDRRKITEENRVRFAEKWGLTL